MDYDSFPKYILSIRVIAVINLKQLWQSINHNNQLVLPYFLAQCTALLPSPNGFYGAGYTVAEKVHSHYSDHGAFLLPCNLFFCVFLIG